MNNHVWQFELREIAPERELLPYFSSRRTMKHGKRQ
jgi:hypothetical protein